MKARRRPLKPLGVVVGVSHLEPLEDRRHEHIEHHRGDPPAPGTLGQRVEDRPVGDLELEPPEVRRVAGEGLLAGRVHEEEAEPVGELPRHDEQGLERRTAVEGDLAVGGPLLDEAFGHLVQDLSVQVALGVEVPVDDQLGDAGLLGHVVDGGRGEAAAAERRRCRTKDLRAPLGRGERLPWPNGFGAVRGVGHERDPRSVRPRPAPRLLVRNPSKDSRAGGPPRRVDPFVYCEPSPKTLAGDLRPGRTRGHVMAATTTTQVEFTEAELLADHPGCEPLFANGRRCHGGFDADGHYRSPRTLNRVPAIDAWQTRHLDESGTELLSIDLESFPAHYPNVAQTHLLLDHDVIDPTIAILTRIGTVEGFGAFLRHSIVPDLQRHFDDPIDCTATAHLDRGLIEAHARDEAGHGEEAGHKEMWWAARDLAFDHPLTEDQTLLMLERMGIAGPGGNVDLAALRAAAVAARKFPADLDFDLEALVERMVRLLLIEISAFHTFRWAEEILGDADRVGGDGEAGRLISYIRADETPHVGYLITVLSEMRSRRFRGEGGRLHDGAELIDLLWAPAVEDQRSTRRWELTELNRREVELALGGRRDSADLLAEFDSLGDVQRLPDGTWVDRPSG